MKKIKLWHGGRNLESDYLEFKGSKKDRWQHGPGLYLTTHYDRASQYAKGNGKTYMVTIEEGNDIKDISIDISFINEFVICNVKKSKQKEILNDIYQNMNRMNSNPLVKAEVFLNLIINHDAITIPKTKLLNKFLVNHNVDYCAVNNYGGRDEKILVVFNNKKIKSVKPLYSKDVVLEDYQLPFEFKAITKKLEV